MHDDEFPTIIGSGTEHHVSVSEHTGNAKTPKNMVTSHEEETQARKLAFEAQERAALEEKKALAQALAELGTHSSPPSPSTDANIQKLAADKNTKNSQAIAGSDAVKPNIQTIASDSSQDNRQSVANDKNAETNRQVLATDGIGENRQEVGVDHMVDNHQSIAGDKPIGTNRQAIPSDKPLADNRQTLPSDGGDNRQTLNEQNAIKNRQVLEADSAGKNRQAVEGEAIKDHFEPLPPSKLERATVNFPQSDGLSGSKAHPAGPSVSSAKVNVSTTHQPTSSPTQPALQLKRETFNDEFHGRLAGIKHNVEELNERLTDFEEKVHKEDAKLIKGDPNHFKVDLD